MLQRILAIIQKEFAQALRDRATLAIIITMPLLQLVIFGYAINTNIRHIPTVVVDQSMDQASRSYLNDMVNSSYFDIVESAPDQASAIQSVDANRTRVAIVIPPDFAEHVQRGDAQVLILVDGSDLFTSQTANAFASIIGQEHAIKIISDQVAASGAVSTAVQLPALDASLRVLYNPDMKD